jgi:hypothetical protein
MTRGQIPLVLGLRRIVLCKLDLHRDSRLILCYGFGMPTSRREPGGQRGVDSGQTSAVFRHRRKVSGQLPPRGRRGPGLCHCFHGAAQLEEREAEIGPADGELPAVVGELRKVGHESFLSRQRRPEFKFRVRFFAQDTQGSPQLSVAVGH